MTPEAFVEKWSRTELSERSASQEHFIDLCNVLEQPTPATDATGENYCFEKHVKIVGSASKGSKGEHGFVDVWKRGFFAWEYKQKDKYKSLAEAYRQLYQYRDDLDNPPLSVVCDIRTFEIRTHFAGYPTRTTIVKLEELPGKLTLLRNIFTDPDAFRRILKTTETLTKELADEFGELANRLIDRYPPDNLALWGSDAPPVAHFLMKVMFCLFAEDVRLLPDQAFTKIINLCLLNPERFESLANQLFSLMRTGGEFGFDRIPYFNGGLFDESPALPLLHGDLTVLRRVAGDGEQWAGVEPSIFGTLFERILDPRKRAQIGAHYTSRDDILLVVEPVVMSPLRRRWQQMQDELKPDIQKHDTETNPKKRDLLSVPLKLAVENFRRFLGQQRILDPACGSGNFLYVTLQQLLDLEDEIVRFCSRRNIYVDPVPRVKPSQLHGIEINPYAAELAQVVIWIGYLQWLHVHGIENPKRPILDKLKTIEHRDAILDLSKPKLLTAAWWPKADCIIGNPPFLGAKLLRTKGISDDYVTGLVRAFDLPGNSDLCCYWFELARRAIESQPGTRVGLLATQGIRGKENRVVLERIKEKGDIFMAWSDRDWILDGAMVHVSIIGFDSGREATRLLDGAPVAVITSDLMTDDASVAVQLPENSSLYIRSPEKGAKFEVDWTVARTMLSEPNASNRRNVDVVHPWINAQTLARCRPVDWIIDFDKCSTKEIAASYEAPFKYILEHVAEF